MDVDSPDKALEAIKEEDGSSLVENPHLNLIGNKENQRDKSFIYESEALMDGMRAYLDQEYPVSPVMHAGVENEGLQSPIMNSVELSSPLENHGEPCLPIESDLNHDGTEKRFYDFATKEQQLSVEDYESNDKKEVTEDADHIAHHGNFIDNNEFHTEDSYSFPYNSLLAGDNNNCYETVGDDAFNNHLEKSPALDEAGNDNGEIASANFHSGKPEVHAEMDVGNLSPCTETKGNHYSTVIAATENEGMVWENSSLHSPHRTQNDSPSPERQFSISAERSPHTHLFSKQGVQSPTHIDKSATSPSSSRRKHSSSRNKHGEDRKRLRSHDHSSPTRHKSSSERETRHKDGSPRRHAAPSPRRQGSPRRKARSPRSPVRRRDSRGHRRDFNRRSRSRSPYARDRNRRSPRRRLSPRRRSPPSSYSRCHSPRRGWSPPANRNTGLGKPGNNLYVAGFSYATTERDLEKKFSRFGRVTDVRIVRERRSRESRGFGFITLQRDEDADAAIRAVDQTEWNGRIILVEKSKSSAR